MWRRYFDLQQPIAAEDYYLDITFPHFRIDEVYALTEYADKNGNTQEYMIPFGDDSYFANMVLEIDRQK